MAASITLACLGLCRLAKQIFKKVTVRLPLGPRGKPVCATTGWPADIVGTACTLGPGLMANRIVDSPFFWVRQNFIGFIDGGHAAGCIGFGADVGMVFACETAKCFFNVVCGGVLGDTQR